MNPKLCSFAFYNLSSGSIGTNIMKTDRITKLIEKNVNKLKNTPRSTALWQINSLIHRNNQWNICTRTQILLTPLCKSHPEVQAQILIQQKWYNLFKTS